MVGKRLLPKPCVELKIYPELKMTRISLWSILVTCILCIIADCDDIKVWDQRRQPYGDNPCRYNNGNCSHLCLLSPKPPGYTCACPTGVKLIDNKTCAQRSEELLLIIQNNSIYRIALDPPEYTSFGIPLTGIKHAIAIDFDPVDEMLYWTDKDLRVIRRAYLNGTGQEDIITAELEISEGIAIDWVARNLYWTDSGRESIEVSRLNGSSRRVLINEDLMKLRAIALAPELGWMFWTDWNEKQPKIERSNLDGSERVLLVTKDLLWPNGIALDLERKKIYFGDAKTDKIEVCNMDGTDRREVITDNLPHLFGLSILGDFVYWTDWQRRSIDRAHKLTGDQREVILDQVPNVMGLKAVHLGVVRGTNPCANNNGGCSHLCLNKPGDKYVCACQIGYELTKDDRTCVVPDAFLLFARKENIGRISIENAGNDNIIPVTGVKDASALDFDINHNRIYWTDVEVKAITRASVNGSEIETVVDLGLETPEGLAVDWLSHNLYWSDTGTHRIEVARLNGYSRRILLWQNVSEPRCLALDPERGHMYWTEGQGSGSIERAGLDGSRRSVILSHIGRAHGLTIDHNARRLYWADFSTPAVDSYDLQTGKRRAIITQNIVYPFRITQYQDYIYWTDWNTGDIERANKTNGANRTKIHSKLESVTDLLVFHASKQSGWNPCATKNGDCSHLCIALPGIAGKTSTTFKCVCPTHYTLAADDKTCIAPTAFMIYSLHNTIGRLLPDTNDYPDTVLRVQGEKNFRAEVHAIEFDPETHYIYWIDAHQSAIKRALENTSHPAEVVIAAGSGQPYDLALDPLGRLLFWSCLKNEAINVTRLDNGSTLGGVVKGEGEMPRNIAVHPEKRLLFWTDIGGNVKIMQSTMDGKNRVVVASDLEISTSITVDTTSNLIYWTHGKHIEFADLSGENKRVLISTGHGSVTHLTILFDYLYWFDRDSQQIERVNKSTGAGKETLANHYLHFTDLVTVKAPDHKILLHGCSSRHNHGDCSHICLGESWAECSCPQSLVLSDDRRTCRAAPACEADYFTCQTPSSVDAIKKCIPAKWRCDGDTDCPDGSDELGCSDCKHDGFRCQL